MIILCGMFIPNMFIYSMISSFMCVDVNAWGIINLNTYPID